ncbi:MAG TPA: hypothetical protein VMT19_13140 [Thermoanaerobaculaceae bacterium]|nr:hypothetical protein [Thermoanaerobaculaceae bacterium]
MGRILLAIVLGLFAPFVAFMGGAVFEVPGQNPIQERLAGGIAAAAYLAACQFLVAPRASRGSGARWPTILALGAPLLVAFLVAEARDLPERVRLYGPVVVAGWLGIAAGTALAARITLEPLTLESCRRNLRTCAGLLVAVAVVLVAALVPLTRMAGTFPDGAPGATASVFLVIAGLSALVALDLALAAARAGRGNRSSPVALGFLAFLAFVPACFLVIPAMWFVGHGPVLRAVSIISPLCSAAESAVTVLLGATGLRLPETQTT